MRPFQNAELKSKSSGKVGGGGGCRVTQLCDELSWTWPGRLEMFVGLFNPLYCPSSLISQQFTNFQTSAVASVLCNALEAYTLGWTNSSQDPLAPSHLSADDGSSRCFCQNCPALSGFWSAT